MRLNREHHFSQIVICYVLMSQLKHPRHVSSDHFHVTGFGFKTVPNKLNVDEEGEWFSYLPHLFCCSMTIFAEVMKH